MYKITTYQLTSFYLFFQSSSTWKCFTSYFISVVATKYFILNQFFYSPRPENGFLWKHCHTTKIILIRQNKEIHLNQKKIIGFIDEFV